MSLQPARNLASVRTLYPDDAMWDVGCALALPMNEGAGGMAYDQSGFDCNGTLSKADGALPSWVAGRHNYALSFDGVGAYVSVIDKATLRPLRALTLEAWVKYTSGARGGIISRRIALYNYRYPYIMRIRLGLLEAGAQPDNFSLISAAITAGIYHHCVFTYANGVQTLYIDGVPVATSTLTDVDITYDLTYPPEIGRYWDGDQYYYLNSLIDGACIYSRALSASEILMHFLGGRFAKVRELATAR